MQAMQVMVPAMKAIRAAHGCQRPFQPQEWAGYQVSAADEHEPDVGNHYPGVVPLACWYRLLQIYPS
jgi:hypothetical protein